MSDPASGESIFGTGSSSSEEEGGSGRLYNPYAELYGASDLKHLESLYRIPSTPEFLFTEEAAIQRRNWSENLTYYTGCGYLSGAVLGGVKGLQEGIQSREEGDTKKLRVNRVLNASGHRGRTFGNTLGILGLLYAGMESGSGYLRGTDDILNNVIAGLGTGALYKAAAGPRTAAIAGALGGIAAGALVAGEAAYQEILADINLCFETDTQLFCKQGELSVANPAVPSTVSLAPFRLEADGVAAVRVWVVKSVLLRPTVMNFR